MHRCNTGFLLHVDININLHVLFIYAAFPAGFSYYLVAETAAANLTNGSALTIE